MSLQDEPKAGVDQHIQQLRGGTYKILQVLVHVHYFRAPPISRVDAYQSASLDFMNGRPTEKHVMWHHQSGYKEQRSHVYMGTSHQWKKKLKNMGTLETPLLKQIWSGDIFNTIWLLTFCEGKQKQFIDL